MLRRLRPDDRNASSTSSNASGRSSTEDTMTSLQRYRSQTMKDYGLMIEYKHLRQHVPAGIYVLPSFDNSRIWYGTIFIHQGLYRNGIFKFTIEIPSDYNGPGTYPSIVFSSSIFHPYVSPQTRKLDLKAKFPEWDPELHYMVAALTFLKSIFYMKEFPEILDNVANPNALKLFHDELETYVTNVERCVSGSLESVFDDEPNSSIRFTRPIPAHENLRKEFFASLETSEDECKPNSSENNEESVDKTVLET
ncbi:unnamed protein product [Albugo candida]|uniref:UBC core domain-containing protein n=1 Tax=Albugo candida TaxID=65357 RepID=A0A024G8I5_9STRA|nr:unnamed protein product [Albugo candida]|eukprot:CCI43186.1 unnamed protein product [Albugo candida]